MGKIRHEWFPKAAPTIKQICRKCGVVRDTIDRGYGTVPSCKEAVAPPQGCVEDCDGKNHQALCEPFGSEANKDGA